MLRLSLAAALLAGWLASAAPAHGSIVFEQGDAVWISGDNGSAERRLGAGQDPRIAPGGATVVYRSLGSGRRVYAVPAAGGPRRLLLTLPAARLPGLFSDPGMNVDFAAGGRHMLVSPVLGASGRVRRLFSARRPFELLELGPAGNWRLQAFETDRHPPAAWLLRPDGHRISRVLPRGTMDFPEFASDDRSVIVMVDLLRLVRIDLATGARQRVGGSDGAFGVG